MSFFGAIDLAASGLTAERTRQLAESRGRDLATKLAAQKPANAEALKTLAAQNPGATFGEAKVGTTDPIPGLGAALNATSAADRNREPRLTQT